MKPPKLIVSIRDETGAVAEDKDFARDARKKIILPALKEQKRVRLDFTGVRLTTQSFVHACISEAIRTHGRTALKRLEFHGCQGMVRSLIETVVDYSLSFADDAPVHPLPSRDVPQADALSKIRAIVEAVSEGADDSESLVDATGFSERHVNYRVSGAQSLGLLHPERPVRMTRLGSMLVASVGGSVMEKAIFRRAVERSLVFRYAVPHLFVEPEPSKRDIAKRLQVVASLGAETAERRASALLSWRRQILSPQRRLPLPAPERRPRKK